MSMGQKFLYIFFAFLIFSGVVFGALLLVKKVFPNQYDKLPIIGRRDYIASPISSVSEEVRNEATNSAESNKSEKEGETNSTPVPSPSPSLAAEVNLENTSEAAGSIKVFSNSPKAMSSVNSFSSNFKIGTVSAVSSPANYTGSCPKTVKFYGVITGSGAGNVIYTWVKSDGSETGNTPIRFDFASSKTVEFNWERNGGSGWVKLKVLDPNLIESSQATFNVGCN